MRPIKILLYICDVFLLMNVSKMAALFLEQDIEAARLKLLWSQLFIKKDYWLKDEQNV